MLSHVSVLLPAACAVLLACSTPALPPDLPAGSAGPRLIERGEDWYVTGLSDDGAAVTAQAQ